MGLIKYPRCSFYSVKFAYNWSYYTKKQLYRNIVWLENQLLKLWVYQANCELQYPILRAYQPHVSWILTLSCYLLSHDQRYENNCNYNKIAVLFFISYVCFSHNIILLWNIFSTVFLSGVYKPNWLEIQDNITSNPFQLLDFWKNLFLFIYGLQSYRSH